MLVNIEQRTDEWLKIRRQKIGASDAPIIMGVSPWKDEYALWEEKVYDKENVMNYAMQRGVELEPLALVAYNKLTNSFSTPEVHFHSIHDWMMASLDGISLDGKIVVEIKCPGKKDHELAKQGKVPEYYYPQIQHQLAVSDAEKAHYFSYSNDTDVALVEVGRDDDYIAMMIEREKVFYDRVKYLDPPPKKAPEVFHVLDLGDEENEWVAINRQLKELEAREKELRDILILRANGSSCRGTRIKISRIERLGNVNYKKIPQLNGLDLEMYRAPSSIVWKLSIEDNNETD